MLNADYDEYSYGKTMVRTEAMTAEQLEAWAQHCSKLLSGETAKMLLTNPAMLIPILGEMGTKGIVNGIVNFMRNLFMKQVK